jgi:hypothetical protein
MRKYLPEMLRPPETLYLLRTGITMQAGEYMRIYELHDIY